MHLLDSPTLKALIATLPPDPDRTHAESIFLKRERQLTTLRNRAAAIQNRCAEIADALPDASAKAAQELRNERRDLLAEQHALPADLTVAARLYAESMGEALTATERTIQAERLPILATLEPTQAPLREAEYAVNTSRPGQPAYDAKLEALRVIVQERQPHLDRLEDLKSLSQYWQTFVRAALETPESAQRPGGLKLIDGRPTLHHIAAFAAQAGRAVA